MKSDNKISREPADLHSLSDVQLMELRAAVDTEARKRGLNFNVGEIGEKLAISLFKERPDLSLLAAAPRGTKNIDAISREGNRYSIKTLQKARKTGTIYPDPSDRDRQLFEFILIVLVNDELALERVIELDWQQFCAARSWDIRMNAWYVARSKKAFSAGRQIYPKLGTATLSSSTSPAEERPPAITMPAVRNRDRNRDGGS
ncbi:MULTISPECIES: hypothetical protein [unclassified Rhodanobacter]|uniref:hypothetical protein n=1 Tax=unclassified Rhodanobacter TaxID=2621553 RepID=UPI001BDFB1B4|nr:MULTISPECIES: hypothetical protein [unclassified Rhodanobacter]MBT2145677.1 hypothetical protein [Rhodanobacter sp. LX-99]MBT2149826.1 hypothetical protein [Rhodanobacter sp. LX-100]